MAIYVKNEFNLKEAIVNDEVDIIFGDSIELLEEIAHIKGKDRMQIVIRNFMEDNTDSHWFSMKFIPSRNIKGDTHSGRKGIPITFTRLSKKINKETIYYPSQWEVYIGGSKDNINKAAQINSQLTKKEREFIDAVVKELGLLILEYWEIDPRTTDGYNRIREIQKEVESKYIK